MMKYNFNNFILFTFILLVLSAIMSIAFPLSVFSMLDNDGFYRQIMDIKNNGYEHHELTVIHTARYMVMQPFLGIEKNYLGNVLNSLIISWFIIFLFFKQWKFSGNINVLVLVILLFPFFVSMRTSLLFISMFILYLTLIGAIKFRIVFLLGSVIAILSSGTVLNYLAVLGYFLFSSKKIKVNKIYLIPLFLVVLTAMAPSLLNKLNFFGGGVEGVYNMISRSNFFVAITYGKYLSLMVYILFTVLFLLFFKSFNQAERFLLCLCLISLYLFEGLGSLALIPVALYIMICKIRFSNGDVRSS